MLSHLLILAQAAGPAADAAAHGEAASGITKITQEFGLSWPFLLAQILNFSVVAFLLWRFAFKPVLSMLDERQQKIAADSRQCEMSACDIRDLDVLIGRAATLCGGIAHGRAHQVRAGLMDGKAYAVDHAFFHGLVIFLGAHLHGEGGIDWRHGQSEERRARKE